MSSILTINEMKTNIQDALSIFVSVTKLDQRTKCEKSWGSLLFSIRKNPRADN